MGQYYYPILGVPNKAADFSIKHFASSHDFSGGLKLMEHSYVGNPLLNRIEKELRSDPRPLVWAGDYADEEEGLGKNLYGLCEEEVAVVDGDIKVVGLQLLPPKPRRAWGDDVGEERLDGLRYLINHTKKEYVQIPDFDEENLTVHPLSLLTAEGNGRGGGDYRGESPDVGRWARDVISVEGDEFDVSGFDLIEVNFQDDV